MARKPRRPQFQAGEYYHIYNRGRSKLSIFHEAADYIDVVRRMRFAQLRYQITVIAYCLLPNHYHFLLRQEAHYRAGRFPQSIFNGYSKRYNAKYRHSGTIFEGRYKIIHVDSKRYLLHLCRYIHANPVKHYLEDSLDDWPNSNYFEWIDRRHGRLFDRAFRDEHFASAAAYKQFVQHYLDDRSP